MSDIDDRQGVVGWRDVSLPDKLACEDGDSLGPEHGLDGLSRSAAEKHECLLGSERDNLGRFRYSVGEMVF